MATARRTRLSPEQRRAQLLELGVRMLATRTLEELSIEELAAEAGVSRGLLFHYFASKQDFHRAVVEEACAHLVAVTEPDPALPAQERLRASVEAFTSFTLEHRTSYVSLVRGAAAGDAALRATVESARARMAERILHNRALLGLPESPLLATAVRAWLAFAEEAAVQWPEDDPLAHTRLRDFLLRSLHPLIACVSPEPGEPPRPGDTSHLGEARPGAAPCPAEADEPARRDPADPAGIPHPGEAGDDSAQGASGAAGPAGPGGDGSGEGREPAGEPGGTGTPGAPSGACAPHPADALG